MAAPGTINLIPDVISAADGTHTESSITIPGSPYIYKLGTGLPIPYPSGMQVIPPQGVSNAVQISGGGYGSWTQVSSAPGLGQFTVDTTISPTGGQIGFNSGDAGKVVSITYLANTYVNKAWAEAFVTALRDLRDWRGAASGLASLDTNTHVVEPITQTSTHVTSASGTAPTAGNLSPSANTSISVSGNDRRFAVTFTTSATPVAGDQINVAFASAYGSTPKVLVSADGNLFTWGTTSRTSSGFHIASMGTPPASTTFTVICLVEG